MASSSPMTRLMPGNSQVQGMVTVNRGGLAAHISPMTLPRFNASSGQNAASYSELTKSSCKNGSYSSGLGYWKSSSISN